METKILAVVTGDACCNKMQAQDKGVALEAQRPQEKNRIDISCSILTILSSNNHYKIHKFMKVYSFQLKLRIVAVQLIETG
jgi:hypothetical protein